MPQARLQSVEFRYVSLGKGSFLASRFKNKLMKFKYINI